MHPVLSCLLSATLLCGVATSASAAESLLRLATTTSTANSGLTEYLLLRFTEDTSIEVHTIAVGTGKALRLGREGDVDVVLVHAKAAEEEFVDKGYGVDRADVMYNDFVILGPDSDPAKIRNSASVGEAFRRIFENQQVFVSRGDDSGTHKRELMLWQNAGQLPNGAWYREVGQGMGRTLQIANEFDAYTMADRGTWLAFRDKLELRLLYENDPPLHNPYGIIAVNPKLHPDVNYAGASELIKWITSTKAQNLIAKFKIKGEQLFVPSAGNAN